MVTTHFVILSEAFSFSIDKTGEKLDLASKGISNAVAAAVAQAGVTCLTWRGSCACLLSCIPLF